MQPTTNVNVVSTVKLISPRELCRQFPTTERATRTVIESRQTIQNVIAGKDTRLMAIVGPCSIHNIEQAHEYAVRFKKLADQVADKLYLVMRVYFEKPRTTVGWKGLINDPHLNDTFDIPTGLRLARKLLLDIAEMGLPTATELLEPITPQYIADLLSCASIGARTTESPTHRQMASGLSMPVGYKNGTDGGLQVALDAMTAGKTSHNFLGIDEDGATCIVNTRGNPWGFLILRGGRTGTNFSRECIEEAAAKLAAAKLNPRLVVDCSHANSEKDHRKQAAVWNNLVQQSIEGRHTLCGIMLESNINEGNQKIPADLSQLKYGVSVTDACIGWEETQALILDAHSKLK
jgi:3-deoxy-7-phosphoheptulonate synthase